MAWTVTFDAPTLAELLDQMDRYAADYRDLLGVEGAPDFMSLDGPLPRATKGAPQDAPSPRALRNMQIGQMPNTREAVEQALTRFIRRHGEKRAMVHAPRIMGAARISGIPPERYAEVAFALNNFNQIGD